MPRVPHIGVQSIVVPPECRDDPLRLDRFWGQAVIGLCSHVGFSSEAIASAFRAYPNVTARRVRQISESASVSEFRFDLLFRTILENQRLKPAVGRPKGRV